MIRPAEHSDIPGGAELGESLFDQTAWADLIPFDRKSFERTLELLIAGDGLLVAEDGGIAGMLGFLVAPIYANASFKFAQEIFVIARPECPGVGRLLLRAFESEAKERGALVALSSAQVGMRDAALGRVFRGLGYSETERTFLKRL